MEIFPNVHEIRSTFGNRYILQYLFIGDTVVLLDAGIIGTPQSAIFPYMEKIGISPQRLSMVIAMHADGDHHGGLPAIKDASGSTLLACHQGDLALIQDPEYLYQNRYNFLSREHQLGFGREGLVYSPRACKIDVALSAEETIQIAPAWKLRVWHVPGHSEGHLAVYDESNRAAFTSDAVQAGGCPSTTGSMALSPTYYAVDAYLATIRFLENQPIEHVFSGHWPALHGSEVKGFLDQSRGFVESADFAIKKVPERSPRWGHPQAAYLCARAESWKLAARYYTVSSIRTLRASVAPAAARTCALSQPHPDRIFSELRGSMNSWLSWNEFRSSCC